MVVGNPTWVVRGRFIVSSDCANRLMPTRLVSRGSPVFVIIIEIVIAAVIVGIHLRISRRTSRAVSVTTIVGPAVVAIVITILRVVWPLVGIAMCGASLYVVGGVDSLV